MYEQHITQFANAMVNQFEANKGRGGFHGRPHDVVLSEIYNTTEDLEKVVFGPASPDDNLQIQQADILAKCADIANLVMIIAMNTGALKTKPEEQA